MGLAMPFIPPGYEAERLRFGQTFDFLFENDARSIIWNVEAAIEVAKHRPHRKVYRADFMQAMRFNNEARTSIVPAKLMATDLAQAIIILPLPSIMIPGCQVIIDGWHRIARAIMEGLPFLRAAFLTEDDERALRLKDVILI